MRCSSRDEGERDAHAEQDERESDQGHPGDEGEQQEPGDERQRHRPDLVRVERAEVKAPKEPHPLRARKAQQEEVERQDDHRPTVAQPAQGDGAPGENGGQGRDKRIADEDACCLAEVPLELHPHPVRCALTVHVAPPR